MNLVLLISCTWANVPMILAFQSIETEEAAMSSDSCERARAIESELILKYGNPDFSCTTSYIKGAIVKIWCCVEGKRIVYYSFGHEHGCFDSGYEVYPCGSNELPASVRDEIAYAGKGNECWALLDEGEPPCRK